MFTSCWQNNEEGRLLQVKRLNVRSKLTCSELCFNELTVYVFSDTVLIDKDDMWLLFSYCVQFFVNAQQLSTGQKTLGYVWRQDIYIKR